MCVHVPRVGGGRSKKCFLGITFVEQQIGISEYFLVGIQFLRSFGLSNFLVANLFQNLVVGWEGVVKRQDLEVKLRIFEHFREKGLKTPLCGLRHKRNHNRLS